MAEVITRFKLETTQYDSALRDAANSLSKLSDQLAIAGKDFEKFAQKHVDVARSFGRVESGATNVKDKLRDLVNAYNKVAKAYNNLTTEQKQTDFGKAMSQSLQELQSRINSAKKDLDDFKNGSQGVGNILDQLAGKFGISTKTLTAWGAAIGACAAALKVAKDAFFVSEQNIDDWGSTVEMANTTYEAFLTSLNTGDISGFLSRIGQIQKAAFEAYNAIDRLQTMQNIQSPAVAKKQAEVQRMETMLRTGRYVTPIDGRAPIKGMKTGDVLTDSQKKQIADNLSKAMNDIANLTKNEVSAATDAINALYREQAQVLKMSNEEFKKGTASMSVFEENLEKARKYREFEAQHTTRTQMNTAAGVVTQNVRDNVANPYEAYKNWAVFKDDGKLYQRLIQMIQQRSQAEQQYYGEISRAYRGINRAEGISPYGGGGSQLTPQEKAQEKFSQAEMDYQQALEQIAIELESKRIDTARAKEKELDAIERYWKAIGDAREVYDSEELKKAQEKAAEKVIELGGSVNKLIEEQKKAQEAARELTAAQKKAAEANRKMAEALNANDYKAYTTAQKQYNAAQADIKRLQEQPKPVEVKQVSEKEFKVSSDTLNVIDELKKIQGFHIDEKEMTVKFDDEEARRKAEELQGYKFQEKEIPVKFEQPKPVEVTYTESNLNAFIGSLKERLSQADIGSELQKNLQAQLADATALGNLMETAIKNGIDTAQFAPQELWKKVFGDTPGDYIANADWQGIQDAINAELQKLQIEPIKINFDTGEVKAAKDIGAAMANEYKSAASAIGQLGAAMSSIEDPAAKVFGIVAQAIATVAQTFAASLKGTVTPWDWIAAAAAGTATMISTISAIKSATATSAGKYAEGGIVPGNDYNDGLIAHVSSGELILNRAQQNTIAQQLQEPQKETGVGNRQPYVNGEQIFLGLNAYLTRIGRGELVTSKS